MIDMSLTHEQSSPTMLSEPTENNGPKYPYGLEIRLEGETLRKLAIGEGSLPKVGDIMTMDAVVEVVSISKSGNQIEDGHCVCLQIQQMDLKSADEQMNEQQAAYSKISKMYG